MAIHAQTLEGGNDRDFGNTGKDVAKHTNFRVIPKGLARKLK